MRGLMRVVFLGQTGPYAPTALRLLAAQARAFSLALVVDGRRQAAGRMPHRLRTARAATALPEGDSLTDLARALGLPVLETCDVNAPTAVRTIADHEPDWLVCVGFDRLFSPAVLACAPKGGLNAHPSLLPRWRGPSPLFWAARAGEREVGVTVHAMDAEADHGLVYAQERVAVPSQINGDGLYRLCGSAAARLLVPTLERAMAGTLIGSPQDATKVTRAPRPKPEDAFVEPAQWGCRHLVEFSCVAPFFRTPWLRLGDEVFFVRRGVRAEPGCALPAEYVQQGSLLIVRCRDGLAHLEIQV